MVIIEGHTRAFLVAQSVKNLPAMQETWVQFLGQEDPLEKEMATHSSILAWRTLMDRGAWQATVHGVTKCQTRLTRLSGHTHTCVRGVTQWHTVDSQDSFISL